MSRETNEKLTFAYDHSQVYLYDQQISWPEDDRNLYLEALDEANAQGLSVGIAGGLIDLLMVRQDNFEAPLELQISSDEPLLDEAEWDHIVDFPLAISSGTLVVEASGGNGEEMIELAPDNYQARWSGRHLTTAAEWDYPEDDEDANPPDEYRLQLWPLEDEAAAVLREIKRSPAYDS